MLGRCVSRRAVMAWCAAIGLGGCSEDMATRIARDPYLPTMMKDPLYTWRPDGDLARTEIKSPRDNGQLASGSSVSGLILEFRFRTSGDAGGLLRQAEQISANAGYKNDYRVDPTGLRIHTTMGILKTEDGIQIVFSAPA
jgi:hypothetical protein